MPTLIRVGTTRSGWNYGTGTRRRMPPAEILAANQLLWLHAGSARSVRAAAVYRRSLDNLTSSGAPDMTAVADLVDHERLVDKLIAGATQPAPGWTDDAEATAVEAVEVARAVLTAITEVPLPRVYPTVEGGLSLEWMLAVGVLSLEVEADTTLFLQCVDARTREATTLLMSASQASDAARQVGTWLVDAIPAR